DDHPGAHRVLYPLRVGEAECHAVGIERGIENPMALADGHPALLRVTEQKIVERRARDLERLRRGRLGSLREVGVLFEGAVERPETRAPFPDEARRRDGVVDPEGPEDLVAPGKLRLADVESRELLALQQQDAAPALG